MVCCLLMHFRKVDSSAQSIGYFGIVRTENGKGVTNPCQLRYVSYYEMYLKKQMAIPLDQMSKLRPDYIPEVERMLTKIRIEVGKSFTAKPVAFTIYQDGQKILFSKDHGCEQPFYSKELDRDFLDLWINPFKLSGDLQIDFHDETKITDTIFFFCVHTSFIIGNVLRLSRLEIDGAHKEKHKSKFGDEFFVELHFDPNYLEVKSTFDDGEIVKLDHF